MPTWLGLNFQDSSSTSMGELSFFHDHVMMVMSGVIVLITYIMVYLLINKVFYKNLSEGTFIETVWSIVPAFLLIVLVLPSMKVLYFMEDVYSPLLTFKVIAHQWYWSYVVPLFKNFSFKVLDKGNETIISNFEYDSFMDSVQPRLLECSNELVVPLGFTSRFLISSTDVIHSFALPSLGMKVDAFPGRINQLFTNPNRLGIFYGQCSEICGSNHSFMPIMMKVVTMSNYDLVSKKMLLDLIKNDFDLDLYL